MKRKWFSVSLPLLLIVIISSFTTSSFGAVEQEGLQANSASGEVKSMTVYINQVQTKGEGTNQETTLVVDEIDWFEGEEAVQAFLKHEPDAGIDAPPNGYYIVNDLEESAGYPVSPDAEVLMQIYDHTGDISDLDIQWNEAITLNKFTKLFNQTDVLDLGEFPYHITVQDGKITSIVQQYIP